MQTYALFLWFKHSFTRTLKTHHFNQFNIHLMKDFSFITHSHPSAIEDLYHSFITNPDSVDQEYRKFFEGFDFAITHASPNGHAVIESKNEKISENSAINLGKEFAVYQLIRAYRKRGHLVANTNPIRKRKDRKANLDISFFGLTDADLKSPFQAGRALGLGEQATLQQICDRLNIIYTSQVGLEYTYINNKEVYDFLEREFESIMVAQLPFEKKKRILKKLNEGVMFEKFLHTKFIGQKRFSLEGGESTIAGLDAIINECANNGVQEVVMGMAHRGRLNILANILHKTYEQIFNEFEGNTITETTMGSGDVKYHLGFRSNIQTTNGKEINLQLMPNPSHLEAVDPVVVGFARAKADVLYKSDYDKILPILIHGDASVAGQGVVYEVLQMSKLKGYYTGGTIHFVINNQIGFTTDFDDARSADYCTSLAAMVQAPVFHVNGDDPEAVVKVCELAVKYRQEFNSDVFIDMVCYRRHGHNEGDDPKFTQPELYNLIDKHPNPREVYNQTLLQRGDVDAELAKEMEKVFMADLQDRLDEVKQKKIPYTNQAPELAWKELARATDADFEQSPNTAIKAEDIKNYLDKIMTIPDGFNPLRKVQKLLDDKVKLFSDKQEIDWATGELLAYASIVAQGNDVRMSGQDVKRGTFSHRHAVLRDENTNEEYNRISNIADAQGEMRIYNSLLSEYSVMGFEYGYAMATPNTLTIWEAQFGDFVNGAQTMIDQFISSAEAKWNRMNGLVLLLPHGYEGQGPEHSSARLERFLQSSAELNWIVTNITTSANLFHMYRRQLAFNFRKPLINFSPKANLRNPKSNSTINDFINGGFKEILDDNFIVHPSSVKRVLICSGKVYFDLSDKQQKDNRQDIAIVRLEQLYPLPINQLKEVIKKYGNAQWVWVQEEPRNMGAAAYLRMNMPDDIKLAYLTRLASAATATGYAKKHAEEQAQLVEIAFKLG
jgi:2-oxoglutarate dehydrogenase E1 component